MAAPTIQTLAPLIGPAVALAFMMRRIGRKQVVRPGLLWLVPALVTAGAAARLSFQAPPSWPVMLGMLGALGVGAALGRWRADARRLERDADGRIQSRYSPEALIILFLLFAFRYVARTAERTHVLPVDPVALGDLFLAFALGLVLVERVTLYRRCRALLRGA